MPSSAEVIDIHTHAFIRELFEEINDDMGIEIPMSSEQAQNVSGGWVDLTDIDRRKRMMDREGIDKQVISFSSIENFIQPKYWDRPETRVEIARKVNDSFSQLTQDNPDYFGAFADVPLLDAGDVDSAIGEIDRAIGDLGFDGVTLNSNYNGIRLDDERLRPLLGAIEEHDVPVFMHPSNPAGLSEAMLDMFFLPVLIGYPNETALAATRLVLSGRLDEFDLDIIAPHSGGTLPFLAYRIGLCFDEEVPTFFDDGTYADALARPVHRYFEEDFYYDTALSSADQIAYTNDRFPGQVIFGTDTPWFPVDGVSRVFEFVESADLGTGSRADVLAGNAGKMGITN